MLNNLDIQNNWPQIKTEVLNKWNKLSDVEVENTHGNKSSLEKLVQSKYGPLQDFDKTYERICESLNVTSRNASNATYRDNEFHPDVDRFNEALNSSSPERRLNSNYAKVEHPSNFNREADDELSAYTERNSRLEINEFENEGNTIKLNSEKENMQFTTPDEFYPSQNPSPSREDITLGRSTSSATKISTAKAAPISSEVSSNDAKKKL